jgi:hypothetical protein
MSDICIAKGALAPTPFVEHGTRPGIMKGA